MIVDVIRDDLEVFKVIFFYTKSILNFKNTEHGTQNTEHGTLNTEH